MNTDRRRYLRTVIDLYLDQPGTPATARRADWAVAASFYQQGTALDLVLHAIRLATLRRLLRTSDGDAGGGTLEPIHSLAYYRRVLATLPPDAFDPGYIAYVARQHACLIAGLQKRGLAARIPPF
jgi:hypothetical protein